jgi:hypothetical protein
MLSGIESQDSRGGGTGTGRDVQLAQDFGKENFGTPIPIVIKFLTDQPNGWGKIVSEQYSKSV